MDGEMRIIDPFQLLEILTTLEDSLKNLSDEGTLKVRIITRPRIRFCPGHPSIFFKRTKVVILRKKSNPQRTIRIIREGFSPQTDRLSIVLEEIEEENILQEIVDEELFLQTV